MSKRGYKIVSLIVCDDIRKEASGKQTLVGVYNKDLIVLKIPSKLSHLAFRVVIDFERTDFKRIHFVITSPSRKNVVDQTGDFAIRGSAQQVVLALGVDQPEIAEVGPYSIKLGFDAPPRKIGEFVAKLATTDLERAKLGM